MSQPVDEDERLLYCQLPLNHSRAEIRVLTIHEGSNDSRLECSLRTLSLSNTTTNFNALSYTWGDLSKRTSITVNGHSITVTTSLDEALRNLRDQNPHSQCLGSPIRPIWIDALCINQGDLVERTHQVQMMHMIYSAAENVVIWLGPGNHHTDFALDLMSLAEFRQRLCELPFSGRQPFENEILLDVVFKHDLCRRDWWQRLWVRQEFILATNEPIICCGSRAVSWSDIVGCFASLPRLWNYPDSAKVWEDCRNQLSSVLSRRHDTVGIHPMSLDRIRNSFHESRALPLHDAFRYVLRNSAATNPRDLIYGLLGLLEKHDRDRLTVDYTLEPMTVYRQAAYLLWAEHSEQMLSTLLPTLSFRGSSSAHPSWVPDFASAKIRGWQDHKTMQADRPWGRQNISLFDSNKNILKLTGVMFDTVESTIDAPDTFDDIQEILPFLRRAESLLSEVLNRPILPEDPLWPVRDLKCHESALQTLTKSAVSSEELFPGFSDEAIWDLLLSTRVQNQEDEDSAHTETNIRSKLFARLSTMLRGKVTGRKALTTASGFVGVGVQQIRAGDIITLIFGATAPLVLRRSGGEYNIVGSAYVSGLMDPEPLDSYSEQLKSRETIFNIC